MSSAPQLAPANDFLSELFEKLSSLPSHSNSVTVVSCPTVLLVGRNGAWGTAALKSLEKLGSELSYVTPQDVTPEFLRSGSYKLILLDSTVDPEQRKQLTSELSGSEASIFYTFPVENGCWWVPTLLRGQDCHGAPAFRRNEFPLELERIFQEQAES
jgi:hypothetical protein